MLNTENVALPEEISEKRNPSLLPLLSLLFTISFTLIYYFVEHEGSYFFDDFHYGRYAFQVLKGTFTFTNDPFSHRLMNILPVSLLYALFGVSPYITSLWPLLCTIGTLILIYTLLYRNYPVAASFAVLLTGLNFHTLYVSNYLYPDNPAMFLSLAATTILFRYYQTKKHPMLSGAAFVTVAFLAVLAKETAMYALIFYLVVFVADVVKKKNTCFWASAWVAGIMVLVLYFLFYYFYSGNMWQRFQMYETVDANYPSTYRSATLKNILARLTYNPILFFIGSGIIVPVLFTLPLITQTKIKDLFNLGHTIGFWFVAFLAGLLLFWFGSISLSHYKPMVLLPRMFSTLMPPLCILAGFGAAKLTANKKQLVVLAILYAFAALIDFSRLSVVYLLISVGLVLAYLALHKTIFRKYSTYFLSVFLVTALLVRPLYFIFKPSVTSFYDEQYIIENYLNSFSEKNLVYTDKYVGGREMYLLFYNYRPKLNYEFTEFGTPPSKPTDVYENRYLLINKSLLQNVELQITIPE
ncbi:MAG: hypothetical protein LPJ89_05335, partial [Hymenobacteraceae bacterium]|nr:hypothetical protein [Hymenobacteraceae bacterium]MDX5443191.1 hypothetical protein [Hymenobacteraceae bacterium]MDX5510639.1 hypothetical protein [Hymenobacteraceae bacterium]